MRETSPALGRGTNERLTTCSSWPTLSGRHRPGRDSFVVGLTSARAGMRGRKGLPGRASKGRRVGIVMSTIRSRGAKEGLEMDGRAPSRSADTGWPTAPTDSARQEDGLGGFVDPAIRKRANSIIHYEGRTVRSVRP